jgi:uncharacterized membrane protein YoaT (DUF817 family)
VRYLPVECLRQAHALVGHRRHDGQARLPGRIVLPGVLLLVFIVIATLKFHNFWTYPEAEQQNQMIHFLKNVAIMGGLLLLMAHGPGPISVDRRKRLS